MEASTAEKGKENPLRLFRPKGEVLSPKKGDLVVELKSGKEAARGTGAVDVGRVSAGTTIEVVLEGIQDILDTGMELKGVVFIDRQRVLHFHTHLEEGRRLEGAGTCDSGRLSGSVLQALLHDGGSGSAGKFGQIAVLVERNFVAHEHGTGIGAVERKFPTTKRRERGDKVGVRVRRAIESAGLVAVFVIPLLRFVVTALLKRESALERPKTRIGQAAFKVGTEDFCAIGVGAGLDGPLFSTDDFFFLFETKSIGKVVVEPFDHDVEIPVATMPIPVGREAQAFRALFVEVGSVAYGDEFTSGIVDMQVFIEDLRGAKSGAEIGAKDEVVCRIETNACAR